MFPMEDNVIVYKLYIDMETHAIYNGGQKRLKCCIGATTIFAPRLFISSTRGNQQIGFISLSAVLEKMEFSRPCIDHQGTN